MFDTANRGQGLEVIEFSDGVIWSRDDIEANTKTEGTSGNDTLIGTQAGDNIYGFAGNDTLNGGQGSDVLTGGRDSDVLTGSAGADQFVFTANDGADTISDFAINADLIVFNVPDWCSET